ncbi:hypothetical protein ABBQ32_006102 [Trebouxia sp. C0010 RCD-2024]
MDASSRIYLQRNTIVTLKMQLCSTFTLVLLLTSGPAVAGDNSASLWNQALLHHGWPTMHTTKTAHVQCRQMQVNSTDAKLHKTGFHGKMIYTVDLPQAVAVNGCNITVLQLLPAGVYADPYELQNLVTTTTHKCSSGLLSSFRVFGFIDVEKIETDCGPTLLSVSGHYAASQMQAVSCNGHMQAKLTVPMHARYPALQKHRPSGYSSFFFSGLHQYNISRPFLRVEHASETANVATSQCYSAQVQHSLHWTVPTGGMWHMQFVEVVTVLAAVSSLCVLMKTVCQGGTVYSKQA